MDSLLPPHFESICQLRGQSVTFSIFQTSLLLPKWPSDLSRALAHPHATQVGMFPAVLQDWFDALAHLGFFCRRYLAKFCPIFEVKSFSFLACSLFQGCGKCLIINLRNYLYFSQGQIRLILNWVPLFRIVVFKNLRVSFQ